MEGALGIYRRALEESVERYLIGRPAQTLYRRDNRLDEPAQVPRRHAGEEEAGGLAANSQMRISA
jgi:hypothetical protein